jgi:Mrp family chromosome partitioning ATPase
LWFFPAAADGATRDQNLALPAVLRRVIEEVGADFDLALVDAPSMVEEADFLAVASVIPKMVLVVEAGRTRYDTLERIKRSLSAEHVTILGAILSKHRQFVPRWIYRWLAE